ncbi:ATP-binding protein [Acidimangrovimonas sediminis]|uniref:ATP-binding protein n=1 Tax=Acidimangrovimonas sediminis TaxID=2056283 RepID=UPI000C805AA8|nr:ATP-binding protein [Acidimangrovimonas sediminis]
MRETARLLALNYQSKEERIAEDLAMLSASSALHSFTNDHAVPEQADSPASSARAKMPTEDFFVSLLKSRPSYLQLSLISVANGGREMLRVVRKGDEVTTVDASDLQTSDVAQTLPEVFHHDWNDMHPRHPELGHMLFLDAARNPGPGTGEARSGNVLAVAYPIPRNSHMPLGYIVLMVDVGKLTAPMFNRIEDGNSALLSTSSGLFSYGADCNACALKASGISPKLLALLDTARHSSNVEGAVFGHDRVSYYLRTPALPEASHTGSLLIFQEPRSNILDKVDEIALRSLLPIGISLLVIGTFTAWLTRRLLRPLKVLETEVSKARTKDAVPKLPIASLDEIGSVARAFQGLIDDYAQSETRLATLIDNLGEGVITIDGRGLIKTYNPASERIFQWREQEILGKNIEILMPKESTSSLRGFLIQFARNEHPSTPLNLPDVIALRKNGTTFHAELTVTDIRLDGELTLIGIFRDITDRRAADKAKSEFIATISHELRTPLTSIHGALGLMRMENVVSDPVKVRRMAEVALINSERLIKLINDILDIEKLERAEFPLTLASKRLRPAIASAVASFEGYGTETDVSLDFDQESDDAIVEIDVDRITQVIGNLLSNAAKFSDPGGRVQVSIRRCPEVGTVRVSVQDEGCGIGEEAQATIFEKFTQADSSDRRKFPGTGLGLNIARTIVERHGGTIGMESTVGVGTTFYFDLPVKPD